MNYRSLAVAAVAAWVFDSVYGFLVFGLTLQSEFARYPGVFRPFESVNAMLPLMFASSLVGTLLVAYIFAKGRERREGWVEGLRFGIVLASFELFAISIPTYAIYNIGRRLAVETAVAGFVDVVIIGVVLGAIYKPLAAPAAKAVGV
ncbi:MAG: hypothetical protein DMF93_15725 [Acidobacteria bacterium]|nr:MAG: hypothetical protein DMF93_15725 [Acidobacteriota bacterium]